jgi:hypothetical protein
VTHEASEQRRSQPLAPFGADLGHATVAIYPQIEGEPPLDQRLNLQPTLVARGERLERPGKDPSDLIVGRKRRAIAPP